MRVQATYGELRSNVAAVTRKPNRKPTAIHGCSSISFQPYTPEYIIPSSRRRKRSASKESEEGAGKGGEGGASRDGEDDDGGASKDGEDGVVFRGPSSTLKSFERVLRRGALHTAGCCRLGVPRAFCETYNVESHVTMTDSTGHGLWRMRFQSFRGLNFSRRRVYTISNGWREFAYDHSLKVNDRLVFTLLSTSHFLVEFATSNGSSRALLPTRVGEDYPWKINHARLDCLSSANDVDSSQAWQQAMQEKVIGKNASPITSEKEKNAAPMTLEEKYSAAQIMEEGKNAAQTTLEEERNAPPISLEDEVEDVQEVTRKNAAPITLEEDEREELRPLSGSRRVSPTTVPNKQQLHEEMFCQCDTAEVEKRMRSRNDTSWKEYALPEMAYLECKNADGSSYLQIVGSECEIT